MIGHLDGEIGSRIDEWKNRIHPGDLASTWERVEEHLQGRTESFEHETRLRFRDGTFKWFLCRGKVIHRDPQGKALRMVGTLTDIHLRKHMEVELRRNQEQLQALASLDPLTNLFNRRTGLTMLEVELARARANGGSFTIGFLDIDGLKQVNDRLGHAAGDELLRSAAKLFQNGVRPNDVVCRMGGDEFMILFPDSDALEAARVMEEVHRQAEVINREPGKTFSLRFSAGFETCDGLGNPDLEALLHRADQKMYAVKRTRKANGDGADPSSSPL